MNTITTNEFLNSVLETEAWKKVSEKESFSMDMLEKLSDNLDWEEISENQNILWTVEGINRFKHRLNWNKFSRYCPDHIISETMLQKFANLWDWKELSGRDCFINNWTILEKFTDKVDWHEIITSWQIEKPLDFFTKFQQYIPMSKLQDSHLWNEMVEVRAKHIIQEAIGID